MQFRGTTLIPDFHQALMVAKQQAILLLTRLYNGSDPGSLTEACDLFCLQLRKDIQPTCPPWLTPTPGSLMVLVGVLVSIIACYPDYAIVLNQGQHKNRVLYLL